MEICLHIVIWFQEFLSNTNNFQINNLMESRNYFYLTIDICLQTVIWFQKFLSNTNNSKDPIWLIDKMLTGTTTLI